MDKQSTVTLLYRKPIGHFFSIEKIFNQLATILRNDFSVKEEVAPHYTSSVKNLICNIKWARRIKKTDVYHITGDIHYAALACPSHKTILTIHDCGFMNSARGLRRLFMQYLFLKWPVNHCRIITTISERTKQDIIRYTGCAPEKIVVIPNPIGDRFEYREKVINTEKPEILFIGSTPNKNLERVIEALKGIRCELVIVGKIPEKEQAMLNKSGILYRQYSELSEQEVVKRYTDADLLLFPSTFEGFGLPIIEAQQCGRPVITSNISPMKEVAGEGAYLVDPFNVLSIREGVLQLLENRKKLDETLKKGTENVRKYSPTAIGGQYMLQYRKIISAMNK